MSRQRLFTVLVIWIFLIAVTALLGKTSVASNNGQTAADFLNIGVGARAAAMGGAYTSVSDDATSVYWNPAGLMQLNSSQVVFSHFSWYQDISYEYIAVAYPTMNRWSFGLAASYLNYGSIEGYDINDEPTGDITSTYDLATGISAAYQVNDALSVGLTAKYIVVSLAGLSGAALAADIGARYDLEKVSFGLSAVNLGQNIELDGTSEKLPAAVRVGFAAKPFGPSMIASLEVCNPFYGDLSISNGYELSYQDRYYVRAGYSYMPAQDGREFGQSLSFGVGALMGPAHFDYTFSPDEKSTSESIHRFSIMFDF